MKERDIMMKVNLTGQNEKIIHLVGIVSRVLMNAGRYAEEAAMRKAVFSAASAEEAVKILEEYAHGERES